MAAGVIPLLASSAISWIKFGSLNGYPLQDQVWYRTHHVAGINHGHYFSASYLPTGLSTYFGSLGVHFARVFPFFTLPQYPVQGAGHTILFGSENMTSVPGSMPLLLLLALVGVFGILRPSSPLVVRLLAIPFVAAATFRRRVAGLRLPRQPVRRRLHPAPGDRQRRGPGGRVAVRRKAGAAARRVAVTGIALLCAYSVAVNFGMSIVPTGWWSQQETAAFVRAQQRVASALGAPISSVVVHRNSLPAAGPVGQIVIIGPCKAVVFRPSTGLLPWIAFDSKSIPDGVSCRSLTGSSG